MILSTFGSSSLYLNDERRHVISHAHQSSVYEVVLGIIARSNIGHWSDILSDVDPLVTLPTSCIAVVDPHLGFQQ